MASPGRVALLCLMLASVDNGRSPVVDADGSVNQLYAWVMRRRAQHERCSQAKSKRQWTPVRPASPTSWLQDALANVTQALIRDCASDAPLGDARNFAPWAELRVQVNCHLDPRPPCLGIVGDGWFEYAQEEVDGIVTLPFSWSQEGRDKCGFSESPLGLRDKLAVFGGKHVLVFGYSIIRRLMFSIADLLCGQRRVRFVKGKDLALGEHHRKRNALTDSKTEVRQTVVDVPETNHVGQILIVNMRTGEPWFAHMPRRCELPRRMQELNRDRFRAAVEGRNFSEQSSRSAQVWLSRNARVCVLPQHIPSGVLMDVLSSAWTEAQRSSSCDKALMNAFQRKSQVPFKLSSHHANVTFYAPWLMDSPDRCLKRWMSRFAEDAVRALEQATRTKLACVDECMSSCRSTVTISCSKIYAEVVADAVKDAVGARPDVILDGPLPRVVLPKHVVVFSHLYFGTTPELAFALDAPSGARTFPTGAHADLVLAMPNVGTSVFGKRDAPAGVFLARAIDRHARRAHKDHPTSYVLLSPPEFMRTNARMQLEVLADMRDFGHKTGVAVVDLTTSTLRGAGKDSACNERGCARPWPANHNVDGLHFDDRGRMHLARLALHALRTLFAGGRNSTGPERAECTWRHAVKPTRRGRARFPGLRSSPTAEPEGIAGPEPTPPRKWPG